MEAMDVTITDFPYIVSGLCRWLRWDDHCLRRGLHHVRPGHQLHAQEAWLPDGYSQIKILYAFGPSGLKDYGSATLCCKIWSLTLLGLGSLPSNLAQSIERKRSNFVIWQHCRKVPLRKRQLHPLQISVRPARRLRRRERRGDIRLRLGKVLTWCMWSFKNYNQYVL